MDNQDNEEVGIEEPEIEARDAPEIEARDEPLLSTLGTHGALIHPIEKALKLQLRFHAEEATMLRLKEYLGNALYERLKRTVFGDLVTFIEKEWEYKGRLISMMYFHSVYPDNEDEIHFQIRNKRLKFGRREFGMIMGLRFGDANAQVPRTSMCFSEGCDLRKCESSVTLKKIEAAFGSARDDDIKLRMGIVYFIYGPLIGLEPQTTIPSRIFYVVEDLERVETFPWGEFLFKNLMCSWRKLVCHCLTLRNVPAKTEKPNVSGCLHALQLWIFHAMPNIASKGKHAILREGHENDLPSFKRWKCTEGGRYSKTLFGDKVKPWEDIPEDILKTEDDKGYVLTLGLREGHENGGQINERHIDAYVGLLRARMEAHPDQYDKHVTLCYSCFASNLAEELEHWDGDLTADAPAQLSLETAGWGRHTVVYAVWMVNPQHWVLVVMDIESWTLSVYDSRCGLGDTGHVEDIIDKWCKYMRILLRYSPSGKRHQMMLDPDAKPFNKSIETCPQAEEWRYCGLYTLKIMEFLIIPAADIKFVDRNSIHTLRKKMAVDLFSKNLSP